MLKNLDATQLQNSKRHAIWMTLNKTTRGKIDLKFIYRKRWTRLACTKTLEDDFETRNWRCRLLALTMCSVGQFYEFHTYDKPVKAYEGDCPRRCHTREMEWVERATGAGCEGLFSWRRLRKKREVQEILILMSFLGKTIRWIEIVCNWLPVLKKIRCDKPTDDNSFTLTSHKC